MTESGRNPGDPASFGRVDTDGTVYVRTAEGERSVGQVPDVPAEEALAFFTRRFDALELEVNLLQTRIASRRAVPRRRAGLGPHRPHRGRPAPTPWATWTACCPAGRACCR